MADISQIKLPGDNTPHNLVDATARTSAGTSYNNSIVPSGQRLSAATAQGAIDELVQRVWKGTQAAYDALPSHDSNTIYYITDGTNPTLSLPIATLRFSSTDAMSAWISSPVEYDDSELLDGYGNVLAPLDLLDGTTKELLYDLRIEYVQLDSTTLLPKNRYIFNTISAQKMGNSSIYTISCNMIWESMRVFGNIGYTASPSPHYYGRFSIINIPTNAELLPIESGSATNTKAYIDSRLSGKVSTGACVPFALDYPSSITGLVKYANGCYYNPQTNEVHINIVIYSNNNNIPNNGGVIATIPSEYRPSAERTVASFADILDGNNVLHFEAIQPIGTNGEIKLHNFIYAGLINTINMNFVYYK